MSLNLAIPLLAALALLNVALLFFYPASRRMRLLVGVGLVGLSSLLLKDWVEGLIYLLRMP